jgi:DNA-binding transcriptional LysR family regulator
LNVKISLDALIALDAIARNGSFAKAAEELHRVPSALTYTMAQLESDLDVVLFDRSKRRASLSAAGHELLNEGRHLLRAASDLECRIQQVAKGWETELRIAVDTIIDIERLFPLLAAFDAEASGTRIRISTEVLGGTWDALINGRADLIVGAPHEVPAGGGYAALVLSPLQFVFVAAPSHPIVALAGQSQQPLSEGQIQSFRAISVADTSRHQAPRTVGLLSGQDVLTVPTMQVKVAAHVAGLGVGFLPQHLAAPLVAVGKLVILKTETNREGVTCVAWRANRTGRALRWFAQQLGELDWGRELAGV